jgi:copper transport protein
VDDRRNRRFVRRLGLALATFVALAVTPQAFAHAELLTTQPTDDAVVQQAPARVVLRFNEAVETAFGAVRVYDAGAQRVDEAAVTRPSGREVAVGLEHSLARGTYTVTWRVVSADSHPISGAFVFHVGAPGAEPAGIASEVLGDDGGSTARDAATVVRFVDFALLLLAAGGSLALAVVVRDAAPQVRARLAGALAVIGVALAAAAAAGIVLQGAGAGGFGIGEALDWDVVSNVLETRFGRVWLLQGVVALALAGTALALRRPTFSRFALGLAGVLLVTPAAAGHASVSGATSVVADVAHVAAAAVWAGGLAFLVAALVWAGADRWPLAGRAVPRFSRLAVGAVVVLLAAGTLNGYLQVRALRGLWETNYGLLLLGKVVLVLPLLALGAYNNRYAVPRLRAQIASRPEQRRFLRTAGAELGLMVAIVALTAVLVTQPPAKAEVAPSGPYATTASIGAKELNLVVDPAKAGANEIHLYLTGPDGRPTGVDEARVAASLPSRRLGPIRMHAHRAGPGHYLVPDADLTLAGTWTLRIDLRVGEFEALTKSVSVPIRKD